MSDPQDETQNRPAAVAQDDPQAIQRDIERTRAELGETVEALAQKADVKAQVQEKVAERKAKLAEQRAKLTGTATQMRDRASNATPDDAKRAAAQVAHTAEERPLPAIGIALAIGLLLGWLLARGGD